MSDPVDDAGAEVLVGRRQPRDVGDDLADAVRSLAATGDAGAYTDVLEIVERLAEIQPLSREEAVRLVEGYCRYDAAPSGVVQRLMDHDWTFDVRAGQPCADEQEELDAVIYGPRLDRRAV